MLALASRCVSKVLRLNILLSVASTDVCWYRVESTRPAWGQMIADARQSIHQAPTNLVFPILCVFVTVLGFNLLGDGLRQALDVRLSQTRRL